MSFLLYLNLKYVCMVKSARFTVYTVKDQGLCQETDSIQHPTSDRLTELTPRIILLQEDGLPATEL